MHEEGTYEGSRQGQAGRQAGEGGGLRPGGRDAHQKSGVPGGVCTCPGKRGVHQPRKVCVQPEELVAQSKLCPWLWPWLCPWRAPRASRSLNVLLGYFLGGVTILGTWEEQGIPRGGAGGGKAAAAQESRGWTTFGLNFRETPSSQLLACPPQTHQDAATA